MSDDVLDRIRADAAKSASVRDRNRRDFPGVAEIVDALSAAFGTVRILHATEGGRSIGKPKEIDGIDAGKIIAADDWHNAIASRSKKRA